MDGTPQTSGDKLRALAWCGVLGPVVIALAGLLAGFAQEGADIRRGTLSELGAATADKAWLWNVPSAIGGVLILLGAVAVFLRLGRGVRPRLGAVLIGIFGAVLALDGMLFRLDCRDEVDVGCEERAHTWQHEAHEVGALSFFGLCVAAVLLAPWFRRRGPRALFAASSLVAVSLLAFFFGWEVIADSSWAGVVQRVVVAAALAWIGLVSYRVVERAGAHGDVSVDKPGVGGEELL